MLRASSILNVFRTTTLLKQVPRARGYARGTIIGRVCAMPKEAETDSGKKYWIYHLASPTRPLKNSDGDVINDEYGFPVVPLNWFYVFNFQKDAKEKLADVKTGDMVLVDGGIVLPLTFRSTYSPLISLWPFLTLDVNWNEPFGDNKEFATSQIYLHELSHRVLAQTRKPDPPTYPEPPAPDSSTGPADGATSESGPKTSIRIGFSENKSTGDKTKTKAGRFGAGK
ncbi:hypothetical protein TREMEDRAFT_64061 [Tremella mesenterica DSM 1558]|uniref:uncharacterized protein n=1 Tax=Tremella mesenterica (strain ATCC 24925 / CBS 8224 / DSM 1558 / NBRC 9311 / NRRL Y-6157 / RJB 2259-6 / UBC 559-6) TaxID=578456 RepID=UPI0003F4A38E|nr:uncharacterized protein TREMEDRAFT_64061 [Tremella mesenterica DSM 1558]EIW67469.1 hypothetical protein TREMEDRAFT_64061 [Tremella mesenterica DSM 1558]